MKKKSKSQNSSLEENLQKKTKSFKNCNARRRAKSDNNFFSPQRWKKRREEDDKKNATRTFASFGSLTIVKKFVFSPKTFAVFCFPFHYICRWDAWKLKKKAQNINRKFWSKTNCCEKWFETERILQTREPKIGPFFKKKFTAALQNNAPVDLLSIWGKKFAWDIPK